MAEIQGTFLQLTYVQINALFLLIFHTMTVYSPNFLSIIRSILCFSSSHNSTLPKPMRRFRNCPQTEKFSSDESEIFRSIVVEPSSVGCFPLLTLLRLLFSMISKHYNKKNKKVIESNRTIELLSIHK